MKIKKVNTSSCFANRLNDQVLYNIYYSRFKFIKSNVILDYIRLNKKKRNSVTLIPTNSLL